MGSLCSRPSTRDTVASISVCPLQHLQLLPGPPVLQQGNWLQIKAPGSVPNGAPQSCLPRPSQAADSHHLLQTLRRPARKHLSLTREYLCVVGGRGLDEASPLPRVGGWSLLTTHPFLITGFLQHSSAQRAEQPRASHSSTVSVSFI